MKADFCLEMTSPRNAAHVFIAGWRMPPSGFVKLNVDAVFSLILRLLSWEL